MILYCNWTTKPNYCISTHNCERMFQIAMKPKLGDRPYKRKYKYNHVSQENLRFFSSVATNLYLKIVFI